VISVRDEVMVVTPANRCRLSSTSSEHSPLTKYFLGNDNEEVSRYAITDLPSIDHGYDDTIRTGWTNNISFTKVYSTILSFSRPTSTPPISRGSLTLAPGQARGCLTLCRFLTSAIAILRSSPATSASNNSHVMTHPRSGK
jgi:hypothetical protein